MSKSKIMFCVFPTCNVSNALSHGITLYRFPEDEPLRSAWLEALGKEDCELDTNSAVCSDHFLTEDFLKTRTGRKLRSHAVPVDHIQMCRICFARNCKLNPLKDNTQPDLARPSYAVAYETLTGLSIEQSDKLPPYLCHKCANQLLVCVRFKARTIRAQSILLEIINDYGYITLESIQSISRNQNPYCSDVTPNYADSQHVDSENTSIDNQELNHEYIALDDVKLENDGVFDQNILITDIRSADDKGHISKTQIPIVCNIKAEHCNNIIEGMENNCHGSNNTMVLLPGQCKDMVDHGTRQDKVNELQDVNTDSNNYSDFNDVFIHDICSLNETFSRKRRQNIKLSSSKIKKMKTEQEDNQTEDNGQWKGKCNSGLLLSYKLLSCAICNYRTVSKHQLEQHLDTHAATKTYNCNRCYYVTKSKSRIKLHMETHSDRKLYSCHICNKTFRRKIDLQIHLRIHTGEKPYTCDTCGKKFTQQNHLTAHRKVHTGDKSFSCNICVKKFRQRGQLQNHLRIHSGERPFSCNLCDKAFIQRGQLQNHLRKHSNE